MKYLIPITVLLLMSCSKDEPSFRDMCTNEYFAIDLTPNIISDDISEICIDSVGTERIGDKFYQMFDFTMMRGSLEEGGRVQFQIGNEKTTKDAAFYIVELFQ